MSDTGYRLRKTLRALDVLEKRSEELKQASRDLETNLKAIQAECPHFWEYIPECQWRA